MRFRPCIDIHNGRVKQVVGSSVKDEGNQATENFVSDKGADYFAKMYKNSGLKGGHIILLNSVSSEYYDETKKQALSALNVYRGGMQIGGGINADNALEFINAGASHVIVTSYVFSHGQLNYDNLRKISNVVGRNRLVLDLSCRRKNNEYYIVTDRWQKFTDEKIDDECLDKLSCYCDEFLIHAVDVEGKNNGIEKGLAELLGKWDKVPITYAGGIKSDDDIIYLNECSKGKLDFTVGSALDIFGGHLEYEKIVEKYN